MTSTPITLTVYDPVTNEVQKTLIRSIVPWRLLKRAVALIKQLKAFDVNNLEEGDIDAITSLVVDVFHGQVTLDELYDGCDISEMMPVIQAIISKAMPGKNPTLPG